MGVYLRKRKWYIDYIHLGKRHREPIGCSKKQAELALKKIQVGIAENKYFDVRKEQKICFSEMANEYLEKYSKSNKRSYSHDKYNYSAHLLPAFGELYLNHITPGLIEEYKIERTAKGISPAKVNRELALLKHIYTKAIEWGKATDNPVKKVKMFRENNQRVRFLEKDEIKKLMDSSEDFLKPIIAVALNTGMRQGEIISLKWPDIDLIRGVILVRNPKNGHPRYIPMNKIVKYIFGKLRLQRKNLDNQNIFYYNSDRPLTRFGMIRGAFKRAVEKAEIKDFHFHDLRHRH
ncbi:MAG: Tyrosine recombinase XerC [Elusimicrobia bacterium ADurb.Bin231]|nr:MAG: Tyrosine recombinase XerC [Elusimicrobia bacterium ADurb.Bin231]